MTSAPSQPTKLRFMNGAKKSMDLPVSVYTPKYSEMSKKRAFLANTATDWAPPPKRQRAGSLNKTVQMAVARELVRASDTKYTDSATTWAPLQAAGVVTSATANLTRGTAGFDNFLGNHITPKGFTVKYAFLSSTNAYSFVRVMVFQWFDASVPTVSGLLQQPTNALGVISPVLVTNKSQMKVLANKTHLIIPQSEASTTPGQGGVFGEIYVSAKRLQKIKFNSTTTALQDGGIYILLFSDDATAPFTNGTLYSRLSFTDS